MSSPKDAPPFAIEFDSMPNSVNTNSSDARTDNTPPPNKTYFDGNEPPASNRPNTEELTLNLEHFATHSEVHKGSGKYIKSMIYGGLDGIVSVFVSVAAVGQASVIVVIILGMAKLFSGAISMGIGDWMSTAADVDQATTERKRETWECDNYIEGEIEEMVQLYVEKGLSEPTARRLFEIVSPHRKLFIDMMMVDELGILPEEEGQIPWKHGAVNFLSFVAFGIVPLIAYIVIIATGVDTSAYIFYITIAVTVATLFMMGAIKGKLTGTKWYTSGLSTIIFGSIGAMIGWAVSYGLHAATGVDID